MVTKRYTLPDVEFLWYEIVTWDGDVTPFEGMSYMVDDDCVILYAEDGDSVTRALVLSHGDKVVISPLGWLNHSDEIESMLDSVLG